MKPGTATLTTKNGTWFVEWMNVGSWLRSFPMAFASEAEAREFCRSRRLRVMV